MKLPRIHSILFTGLTAALLFSSCQKDLDVFVPDSGQITGPDTSWYNTISSTMPVTALKNVLLIPLHKDSFQLNSSVNTVHLASGIQCLVSSGSVLTSSSQPVGGKVYVESLLLKKKGHMIRMGTPTTSDGKLLVSGGEIFIRLRSDSFPQLQLAQNNPILLEYADIDVSTQMQYFNGIVNSSGQFNWLLNTDSSNQVLALQQAYRVITNQLNWINCDYFLDTAGIQQTIVSTVLPAQFTNANTIAYTVFNNIRSVAGMYGNANTKKFSSGKLPVNKLVTVVVISKQGDDYYLGHETVTTSANGAAVGSQQVAVTPIKTPLNNIITYLENL